MKKSSIYNCYTVLLSNGHVKQAYCGCPAGVDGRCNHIAATLFALEEYCTQRQKQQQGETSRTSIACTWNVPRKRKGEVLPISQMKFQKHEHGKEKKDCESVLTPGKDVRASHQRIWTNTKRYNVLTAVRQVEEKTGQIIGLHHILPLKTNSNLAKIIEDEHDYCKVKVPSEEVVFECSQIEEASKDVNLPSIQPEIHVFNTLAPYADMVRNECESVKRKLFLTQDEAADVEKNTRGQSADSLWHDNRNQRITSSKCYRCAVLKNSTSPTKAIQEVLGYKEFPPTKEMKEGLSKEPEIIEEYLITMKERGHKEIWSGCKCLAWFFSKQSRWSCT